MISQADRNFKARIQSWKEAFRDDTTGIHKTIDDLLFNYASFRMAVKIVAINKQPCEEEPINQIIFDMIAMGFWSNLLLGARKLLEKSEDLNGQRGVYSLRAVLCDVKRCRSKLNRRAYVELLCECRYDVEQIAQEHWAQLRAAAGKPVWGDLGLSDSQYAHSDFDTLSGKDPTNRSPDDLIQPEIFGRIEARLVRLDKYSDHVSTHVAHSGNARSRVGKELDQFDIRDARDVLKDLKQVADLMGRWFAHEGGAGLATYIGDHFQALDRPLVQADEIHLLEENWEDVRRDIDDWMLEPETISQPAAAPTA